MEIINFKTKKNDTSKYFKAMRPDQQKKILQLMAVEYKREYQERITNLNKLKLNISNGVKLK